MGEQFNALGRCSLQRGEHPSRRRLGGGSSAEDVAADLGPTLRTILLTAPDGDFPRTGFLKRARIFDSVVRRGYIEPAGYHRDGQWQYRLTRFGRSVRDAAGAAA